jgi:uncharacterized protein (DUF111 family)
MKEENHEKIDVIETNIDDMNPEIFSYLFEALFENKALDVYLTNIIMKKSRPGFLLTVLCKPDDTQMLAEIILKETTTFGFRVNQSHRIKLDSEFKMVKTKLGNIKVRVGKLDGKIITMKPEYEDCRKIALKNKIPLKTVYSMLQKSL